jgi:MoxR-like ATPase
MAENHLVRELKKYVSQHILGQEVLVDRLLIALLCDGHLLVEGAPGLAKTKAIKVLSEGVEGDFHRIQFTPDLLPADLTGTEVFRPQDGSFRFQKGPLFHNLILADEINRAPAKVQSALLEAMAERQITVGSVTYPLPHLFLVMATQNPIEQEGTYPLPEAQMDRFLLHVMIHQPGTADEKRIMQLVRSEESGTPAKPEVIPQQTVLDARKEVQAVTMADVVDDYIVALISATRDASGLGENLVRWLRVGASPRGSIALDKASRAHAWLRGRDHVLPEDVQSVAPDCLRHRIILSYEAHADGVTADDVLAELLQQVAVA